MSNFHISPFDTVLLDFKNDSSYLTKVDPNKPISLNSVQIDTKSILNLPSGQCCQITPFELIDDYLTSDYFQHSSVNTTDDLNTLKKQQKSRSKQANHVRIQISSPRLLTDYKFTNSTQKNQFLLNSESLAVLLEQTAVSRVQNRSKILVFDDFDGVVVGAVCEKLQIDPLKQNVKCDFEQECVDLIKLIGSEFDAVKLRDLQANIKQLFVDFIKNSNIPHYSESCVLCAGDHSASQLKDTLIDCNLLPHRAAHEDGARWPTTPVVFHCNLWRFLSQDDQFLDNLGVFPDPNSKQIFTSEVPMITSDTITKELDLDFIFWVERRLAYYGVNGTALGRVSRLCIVDGKLHNVQKADLVPMLCYADFSDKKFAFDSIIIAAKSRPLPAVKAFIPIANSGAPVSVFAETLPALEEVGNFVVTQRNGIRFGALKCHAVQQQILPNRTHPVMIGPLSTGYVANFFTQLSTEDEGFVKAKYSKDNGGRQKKVR